jgi:hypothetical protein
MPVLTKFAQAALRPTLFPKNGYSLLAVRGFAAVSDTPVSQSVSPFQYFNKDATPASLRLKSGQVFNGTSFGAEKSVFGEAVFTSWLSRVHDRSFLHWSNSCVHPASHWYVYRYSDRQSETSR